MAKGKTDKQMLSERDALLASLQEQMDAQGLNYAHYRRMAQDYADLYVIKEKLKRDIDVRGAMVEYQHGGGQSGWKRNDAVQEIPKILKSMDGILMSLGVRPNQLNLRDDGVEI